MCGGVYSQIPDAETFKNKAKCLKIQIKKFRRGSHRSNHDGRIHKFPFFSAAHCACGPDRRTPAGQILYNKEPLQNVDIIGQCFFRYAVCSTYIGNDIRTFCQSRNISGIGIDDSAHSCTASFHRIHFENIFFIDLVIIVLRNCKLRLSVIKENTFRPASTASSKNQLLNGKAGNRLSNLFSRQKDP